MLGFFFISYRISSCYKDGLLKKTVWAGSLPAPVLSQRNYTHQQNPNKPPSDYQTSLPVFVLARKPRQCLRPLKLKPRSGTTYGGFRPSLVSHTSTPSSNW